VVVLREITNTGPLDRDLELERSLPFTDITSRRRASPYQCWGSSCTEFLTVYLDSDT
jgi:hypothetical protein